MASPLKQIKDKIREVLYDCTNELNYDIEFNRIMVEETRNRAYGDFFTNVAFTIAKKMASDRKSFRKVAIEIAEKIAEKIKFKLPDIIREVTALNGYINFRLNPGIFSEFVLESINKTKNFGCIQKIEKHIIVEHTSANPAHPLHIGHARNAFIGDSIAKMLSYCNANVETHFYVNDCGRQIAILSYAYKKTQIRPTKVKPDHLFGIFYTIITNLLERNILLHKLSKLRSKLVETLSQKLERDEYKYILSSLKRELTIDWYAKIKAIIDNEEIKDSSIERILARIESMKKDLEKISYILATLQAKWPRIFRTVLIKAGDITPKKVAEIMISYEKNEKDITKMIRDMTNMVLDGFFGTLKNLSIKFDSLDWESDLLWNGILKEILDRLDKDGYLIRHPNGAVFLNARKILLEFPEIQKIFFEGKKVDIENIKNPPLLRHNGTTLYLLRDIAYAYYKLSIRKFQIAINVIGVDQKLEQKYVLLALIALGIKDAPTRYHHIEYELVRLPSRKMSSRRGQYITLDEIYNETLFRALLEVKKRYPQLNSDQQFALARMIAKSALKYALLAQAPNKVITFNWERVLDFEQNSGPFIQYAHARAASILRRISWQLPHSANLRLLEEPEEFELIYALAKFPEILNQSIIEFRPDILASYANNLAMLFNKFYQKHPVLKANGEKRNARLILVATFRRIFAQTLKLLGIDPLYRM